MEHIYGISAKCRRVSYLNAYQKKDAGEFSSLASFVWMLFIFIRYCGQNASTVLFGLLKHNLTVTDITRTFEFHRRKYLL